MRDTPNTRRVYMGVYLLIILLLSFFIPYAFASEREFLSHYTSIVLTASMMLCLFFSWRIFILHRETEFRNISLHAFITFLLWGIAEVVWSGYAFLYGRIPMPSIGDAFAIVGYIPLLYIFATTIYTYKRHLTLSDIAISSVFWVAILLPLALFLNSLFSDLPLEFLPTFFNCLYPIFDSMLLSLLSILLLMYRKANLETYWLIISAGMISNTVGDLLYLYYDAFHIYYVGALPDSFMMGSLLTIASGFFIILGSKVVYFKTTPLPERSESSTPQYSMEKGSVYLFEESLPQRSFEVLCDLVTHGVSGLCILRSYPPHMRAKWKLEKTPFIWFSSTETHDSVAPADLSKVIYIVQEFLRKTDDSVVMIEGIEYLITQNDFITVLKMVHAISDLVIIHDSRLIISINPQVLEEKERVLLEREFKIF